MADFDNSGIHELMKDVSRRAFLAWAHGKDSLGYYEALRKEGLMEDEHEAAYTALKERQADQGSIVTSSKRPSAEGGVEMHISLDSRAYKERMINEAIKSLGDRNGDDPQDIAADLKTALRARDHGLPDDYLIQIAELLAEGEDVIVGVDSGPIQ